jgi:PIN domain nuclease of toxin-antitoxin system
LGNRIARRETAAASPRVCSGLRKVIFAQGTVELPLNGEIAILAGELEDLHGDPADLLIAATAITHDAILLTADARLLSWRHALRRHSAEI